MPKTALAGLPIVTAGNVPLLSDSEDSTGRHRVQMAFVPELSNVQDMPDWPIFFANLVGWRRGGLPGIAAPNVRLGQTVAVVLAREAKQAEIVSPDRKRRAFDVRGRRITVPADRVGLHAIKLPEAEYPFSCNAISRGESDLSGCQSGRWGSWSDSDTYQDRQASLSWIFLLVAMGAMVAHMAVIRRDSEGGMA